MLTALLLNTLLFPFKWIVNLIRALIYRLRGAIDTSGVYLERDSMDGRIMILEVRHEGVPRRVRLYADFDNNSRALSQAAPGDRVPIKWIVGAKWAMGRKK